MSKIFTFRSVEKNDIKEICTFPKDEIELLFMFPKAEFPLTIEQLNQAITSRHDSTVVLYEDKVVGFANFYICEDGEKCAIGNVIIKPNMRGTGASVYLVNTMINIARSKYHVKKIEISCFNTNTSGLLLYTKLGFVPTLVEKRIDKQGNPIGLIHLELNIPS